MRGLGNPDSFESAAHGAGRRISRTEAKAAFDLDDVELQTEGVECRKDAGVIDKLPGAYKDIDEVMENQKDLVEIVETLKQLVCVKGCLSPAPNLSPTPVSASPPSSLSRLTSPSALSIPWLRSDVVLTHMASDFTLSPRPVGLVPSSTLP